MSARVYDPATQRWYKDGYSPEQLTRRPIDATCGKCGGHLEIYPAGSVCLDGCSPPILRAMFTRALDKQRVSAGYMAASEILEA